MKRGEVLLFFKDRNIQKMKFKPLPALIIVSFSYDAIYNLQIMKSLYYSSVQYGFSITNTQVGEIFSICGICAMFAYLCGTFFQTRFSAKCLMTGSLTLLGGFSLFLSFLPPYPVLLIVFGLVGFLVNATFYPAYLSAMQNIAGPFHQGEAYAKFYIFSSIFGSVISLAGFGVTSISESPQTGLKYLLILFSVLNFLSAVCTVLWFPSIPKAEKSGGLFDLRSLKIILRNKRFWLAGLIIFANYINFSNLTYTLPYLTSEFHLPVSVVNAVTILRMYVVILVAAPIAGHITDKIQSAVRLMKGAFILYIFAMIPMIFLFRKNAIGTLICVILLCFFVSMGKSMSLVIVTETGLSPYLSGLAYSVISFLAYSPDAFYYYISGKTLDIAPTNGFFYIFLISGIMAAIGAFASRFFQNVSSR